MIQFKKPQVDAGIAFGTHKEAPSGEMPPGACVYTLLTCGYCRNPQFSEERVENLAYSATVSSAASVSASASVSTTSASSSTASSVTPTRTLTTAVISR